jgi:hypothetical protein
LFSPKLSVIITDHGAVFCPNDLAVLAIQGREEMAFVPPEHSREIRSALAEIVAEHGPEALSMPKTMTSLLADLMPDAPQLARLMVAAAQDRVADELRGHVVQGMDIATAARLVTSAFASATLFTPEACAWVVAEFAIALGIMSENSEPAATILAAAEPIVAAAPTQPEPAAEGAGAPTLTADYPPVPANQAGVVGSPGSITVPGAQVGDLRSAQTPVLPQASPESRRTNRTRSLPVVMLGAGIALGIAGLIPGYGGPTSIAKTPELLAPHVLYLAAWAASGTLIALGGTRLRVGALIGLGTSIVAFGRFFADFGYARVDRAVDPGIVLGLVSWLACAIGSVLACRIRPAGQAPAARPGRHGGHRVAGTITLLLAALGAAIAWVPPWDRIGSSTCCNAFDDPKLALVGDVAFLLAIAAVAIAVSFWRGPVRLGAALLGGAVVALVAQAIEAFIGSARSGDGLTPAAWIYSAFVAVLVVYCVRMIVTSAPIGKAERMQDTS